MTEDFIKPKCKLIGEDGNVFNLMGVASRTLKKAGYPDKATEMCEKIRDKAESYNQALTILQEYVEVI